jgi:hypothetical protein
MPGSRPGKTPWITQRVRLVMHGLDPCIPALWRRDKPRRSAHLYPIRRGLISSPRPRLLDARLRAGQDALDHPNGSRLVMHGLDPCIQATMAARQAPKVCAVLDNEPAIELLENAGLRIEKIQGRDGAGNTLVWIAAIKSTP